MCVCVCGDGGGEGEEVGGESNHVLGWVEIAGHPADVYVCGLDRKRRSSQAKERGYVRYKVECIWYVEC